MESMKTTAIPICLTALLSGCFHHRPSVAGGVPAPPEPYIEVKSAPPVHQPEPGRAEALPTRSEPDKNQIIANGSGAGAGQLLAEINARLEDAYFDYDQHALRDDAQAALRHNASLLRDVLQTFRDLEISVEGHCDERGSAEYNLALGDLRGRAAKEFLALHGVEADRLLVISYGREKPQCSTPAESCWQINRRAHLSLRPAPTIH
jgi:peptidoglycan-associated lipoprotein